MVTIINEPYQLGERDGELYFEAHMPLEDDAASPEERLEALLDGQLDMAGYALNEHLRDHIRSLAAEPRGLPVRVAMYDIEEVMARVRVVENTVEMDPDAPTLSEVREMMEEADAEAEAELESL